MTTKPFDLARAMANGGRCQTRDGRPARIICTDRKGDFPIVALVGEVDQCVFTYHLPGSIGSREPHPDDLVNIPVKRSGLVNVYPADDDDGRETSTAIYPTRKEADEGAGWNRVACVPIEWEE